MLAIVLVFIPKWNLNNKVENPCLRKNRTITLWVGGWVFLLSQVLFLNVTVGMNALMNI